MASIPDPRLITGNTVYAKAHIATSQPEAARLFGKFKKTTFVPGTVVNVVVRENKGRRTRYIEIHFNIGDKIHKKTLSLSLTYSETQPKTLEQLQARAPTSLNNITPPPIPVPLQSSAREISHATRDVEQSTNVQPATQHSPPPTNQNVESHGRKWELTGAVSPLNGSVPRKSWRLSINAHQIYDEDVKVKNITPYECFISLFPMSHLRRTVEMTNRNLLSPKEKTTSQGEILKLFGVLVLITRCQFGSRRELWSSPSSKWLPSPKFGCIMSRNRFESLMRSLQFSEPETLLSRADDARDRLPEERWGLVAEFVYSINNHRKTFFTPSELICVDESMCRWYGLGGSWSGVGLPHYVSVSRKPESGCEIRSSCCGRSGILLRLDIVDGSIDVDEDDPDASKATTQTLKLVQPWLHTNRIVCADSWFSSVTVADVLLSKNTKYIGIVKTATRQYPMSALSEMPVNRRGDCRSYVNKDENNVPKMVAMMGVDKDRKFFVGTTGDNKCDTNLTRERYRKVGNVTKKVEIQLPLPNIAKQYFQVCSKIDEHNRCRQDDLQLERKVQTKDWSDRVNHTLLGMCIVDSWLLFKSICCDDELLTQNEYYIRLAEDLIDNQFDGKVLRKRKGDENTNEQGLVQDNGLGIHLTCTDKFRKGNNSAYKQGCCQHCKKKSKYICSNCREKGVYSYVCYSTTGRDCFSKHIAMLH